MLLRVRKCLSSWIVHAQAKTGRKRAKKTQVADSEQRRVRAFSSVDSAPDDEPSEALLAATAACMLMLAR
eukprot:SAG25_NODE_238_length_11236_cov_37.046061_2_plen_70_part_00